MYQLKLNLQYFILKVTSEVTGNEFWSG